MGTIGKIHGEGELFQGLLDIVNDLVKSFRRGEEIIDYMNNLKLERVIYLKDTGEIGRRDGFVECEMLIELVFIDRLLTIGLPMIGGDSFI